MRFQKRHILPVISFVALVTVMGLLSVHNLSSIFQDIGRHITIGRIIWETHQVPKTNLFSYTARDFPFLNHHWFGEVLLYLGDRVVGLKGLLIINAFLVTLGYGLALAAAWRPRVAVPALMVGLLAAVITMERTDLRPETLSLLFFGWYLFVLYRKPRSWLLWTLPAVQLVWVNTHIYFFMGPFLFVAWWLGEIAQRGVVALRGRRYWLLAILIALATFCNPWGLVGAIYPLRVFSNYGYSVLENKSPFFLARFGYPQMTSVALYLGIVCTALSFAINWRHLRRNIFGLIVAAVTAAFALIMIRNFPLFALAMMPIVLTNIDQAGWHSSNRQGLVIGLVLLALFASSIVSGQIYRDSGMVWRQFGLAVPSGAGKSTDFFRQAGLKGPIFNNFDVGSFLIWKLPQEPVFIDGRPEAYPADFIQNIYIKMQEDPAVWDRYSAQYGINTIFWDYNDVTPWSGEFVSRITKDPHWIAVYRDGTILILVRNAPANSAVIAKYRL